MWRRWRTTAVASLLGSRQISLAVGLEKGNNKDSDSSMTIAVTQLSSSAMNREDEWTRVWAIRTALHLTCFKKESDVPSHSCCSQFLLTLDQFFCHKDDNSDDLECAAWMEHDVENKDPEGGHFLRSTFAQSCPTAVAFVPPPPPLLAGVAQQKLPSFYMAVAPPRGELERVARQWIVEFDETSTINKTSWFYGKCVQSPFHLPTVVATAESLVEEHNDELKVCDTTTRTPGPENVLEAELYDHVSTTGGMHREQTISIQIPSAKIMDKAVSLCDSRKAGGANVDCCTTALKLQGTISLLLPLSRGVYIDVDEFYASDKNQCTLAIPFWEDDPPSSSICPLPALSTSKCRVTLMESTQQIMDIEKPSFVSPQHVVRFLLELNHEVEVHRCDSCPGLEHFEWKFSTMLHTRYPLPQQPTSRLPLKGYRFESTPIPMLAAEESFLEVAIREEPEEEEGDGIRLVWTVRGNHIGDDHQSIQIATPVVKSLYYWFVVITTMCASLWGVAIMMKEILSSS